MTEQKPWELTDDKIREAWHHLPDGKYGGSELHIAYEHADVTDKDRVIAEVAQQELVKWLNNKRRNTYLPLEDPCEWVAFSLEDWQALLQDLGLKKAQPEEPNIRPRVMGNKVIYNP